MACFLQKVKNEPEFGGFMLWDAAWDQQNIIDRRLYSDHIGDIIERGSTGSTTTQGPSPATGGTTLPGTSPIPGGYPTPGASSTSGGGDGNIAGCVNY